jgi:hypothetical protein
MVGIFTRNMLPGDEGFQEMREVNLKPFARKIDLQVLYCIYIKN